MTIIALTLSIIAIGTSLTAIARCDRQDIDIEVATQLAIRARQENNRRPDK